MKTEFLEYIEMLWINRFNKDFEIVEDEKKIKKAEANKRYYDKIKNNKEYRNKVRNYSKEHYKTKKQSN